MNETVRKLAKESGLSISQSYSAEFNKFVELFVRECMSVADLPKNASGQWDHLESSEVIAKHFGVEE